MHVIHQIASPALCFWLIKCRFVVFTVEIPFEWYKFVITSFFVLILFCMGLRLIYLTWLGIKSTSFKNTIHGF